MNDESDLLDTEYRQILYIIKLHINYINDCGQLERCRVWLERLSNVKATEKKERNKYLLELANQIHDKALTVPFTKDPPRGALPCLSKVYQRKDPDEHCRELMDWPYQPRAMRKSESNRTSKRLVDVKEQKSKKLVRPFQRLGKVVNRPKSESSSWGDVSDSERDEKKKMLHYTNKSIRFQNNPEVRRIQTGRKSCLQKTPFSCIPESKGNESGDSTTNLEKKGKCSPAEVEALKMRMKDLLEVKNALKDTYCLTEDRKNTVEFLQFKLTQLEKQNAELRKMVEQNQKNLPELEKNKQEVGKLKEEISLLRNKEMATLKQQHAKEKIELEKNFNSRVCELNAKLSSNESKFEEKLKSVCEANFKELKKKDKEIEKLQSQLKCKSGGNEQQVYGLKRCISNLGKVLQKSEIEYANKIEELKKELVVKDMTSQVQLQTQRADLIIRSAAHKQEQLKNALNSLERKYKNMMQTVQMQAMETKKEDSKVIDELKEVLRQNNIQHRLLD